MVGVPLTITTDYTRIGKLQYLTDSGNLPVLDTEYGADVVTRLLISPDALAGFVRKLNEATGGQVLIEEAAPVTYILADGQPVFL